MGDDDPPKKILQAKTNGERGTRKPRFYFGGWRAWNNWKSTKRFVSPCKDRETFEEVQAYIFPKLIWKRKFAKKLKICIF